MEMASQTQLGINLPIAYYNLYMILIPVVVVLWFLRSVKRFYRMLRVRAAMLTGRLIHIRYASRYVIAYYVSYLYHVVVFL